jgi:hypothetical protein
MHPWSGDENSQPGGLKLRITKDFGFSPLSNLLPTRSTARQPPPWIFDRPDNRSAEAPLYRSCFRKQALNGDTFVPGEERTIVIDPDGGSWYRHVDSRRVSTLTIEVDDRLLVSAGGCMSKGDRYTYLGSASKPRRQ